MHLRITLPLPSNDFFLVGFLSRLLIPTFYLPYNSFKLQVVGDCEAEIKCLQEQLTEANKAKEALQATQSNQGQSSQSDQATDIRATGDASQVLQEEVAKLRQEVFKTSFLKES